MRSLLQGPMIRRVWGLGIAGVVIAAVTPYPVRAFIDDGEVLHRIHDTVGSVHYLLLWSISVIVWTLHRVHLAAWNLAVASAVAMVVTSIPSGDLFSSLSILPLVTLVPLWPDRGWWNAVRHGCFTVRSRWPDPTIAAVAVVLGVLAVRLAPDLVRLQDVAGSDPHGARFHYGGMAAVYVALALCTVVVAFDRASTALVALVGVSSAVVGVLCLAWPNYDSSLPTAESWAFVVCGSAIMGRAALAASSSSGRHLRGTPPKRPLDSVGE